VKAGLGFEGLDMMQRIEEFLGARVEKYLGEELFDFVSGKPFQFARWVVRTEEFIRSSHIIPSLGFDIYEDEYYNLDKAIRLTFFVLLLAAGKIVAHPQNRKRELKLAYSRTRPAKASPLAAPITLQTP
jgi:hypothetical protein